MGPKVTTVVAVLAAASALCVPAGAATYAKGLDVSHWNGTVDWLQVAGDGYTFAFAKATESTTFTDVTYGINRAGTIGLGLRLGAYHFARPAGSGEAGIVANAIAQADYFVDVAQPKPGDLPPALDLENRGALSQDDLLRWTQAWLGEVVARTGVKSVVYTSPNFWKTSLGDSPVLAGNGHPLWVAHWTQGPSPLVPGANWGSGGWSFWQWTDCAKVAGIARCSDGDRVNGPSPIPFAIPAYPRGAPVPNARPAIVGVARAAARLAAVPGTWNGGKPVAFTYQWLTCDAAGAGCTPIPGATLPTYTPAATDAGHALSLAVTAASASGTAVAAAPATLAIAGAASSGARPAVLTAPLVTGTAQVGQTLTGAVGAWSGAPTSFAYQWHRCDAAGAACAPIASATASTYTPTPGDIASTLSLVVTATGKGGTQTAAAPTTGAVAAAPVPTAVGGSLTAAAGAAGAVVTTDGRATVTWQPGAVPVGTAASLAPAETQPAIPGTGLVLTLAPPQQTLPWPVDIAYAAAPAGAIVGASTDAKTWLPVTPLTSPVLPAGVDRGTYLDGSILHILTRGAARFALFRPGGWGDPRRISASAPVIRSVAPAGVVRQRDGTVRLVARISSSSQAHLYVSVLTPRTLIVPTGSRVAGTAGRQALVLRSGAFPLQLRLRTRSRLVQIRVSAVDPWGRTGAFTLSARIP